MTFDDLLGLVRAIAWPVVAIVAIILLRKVLPGAVRELGRRATKISVYKVAVEFAPSPARAGVPAVTTFNAPIMSPSGIPELQAELARGDPIDYMIIHLGIGESWLTSRLFLWGEILRLTRGLRCFAFVRESEGTARRYVGVAPVEHVRSALARQFSWLEAAWARAYASVVAPPGAVAASPFDPRTGRLTSSAANGIVLNFVTALQQRPPQSDEREWVRLEHRQPGMPQPQVVFERATWISPQRLEHLIGPALETGYVIDTPEGPRSEVAETVVRMPGQFVALVDRELRFSALVDRYAMLEASAR